MRIPLLLLIFATGCNFQFPDERNCDDRTAYYPDEDGDGLGEPTDIYIGCEAPEGWVDNVDTGMPYTGGRRRHRSQGWRLPRGIDR